ncbi:MAG: metallophosphoesterase family protein, partial [Clostridiales bacterium]|nr:metallophosphoesterase family protein [Clostridiales bacterium]
MRFLVASDLHGDSYWTERVLEAFRNEKADRLVLLGDILYHGPRNDLPQ